MPTNEYKEVKQRFVWWLRGFIRSLKSVKRIQKVSLEPIVARSVVAGVHFDAKAGAGEEAVLELLKCSKGIVQDETRP